MPTRIYTITSHGFDVASAEAFLTEADLQTLVAEHPELLAGDEMTPADPRRWLLVGREIGIPGTEDGVNRWAIDHIFIDQACIPTFVEVKRASNPEIRRAIIGQMLEYATHARYWPPANLRARYEATHPGDAALAGIRELLQVEGDPDIDTFWAEVDRNLDARRIRLIFLADELPDPLVRVIEFLNEEMPGIEAIGVEVRQFIGNAGRTLVPGIRGTSTKRNSLTATPRASVTRERFMAAFPPDVRDAAAHLIDGAVRVGASLEWGSSGVSIRGRSPYWPQPLTVAWLYPTSVGWAKTRDFSFGSGAIDYPSLPDALRLLLTDYCDKVAALPYAADASSQGVRAAYVRPQDTVQHLGELEALLFGVITQMADTR